MDVDQRIDAEGENFEVDQQMNNGPPAHPEQPQDTISFDQSGSTANYLRNHGQDIVLTLDQVMQGQITIESSSSDSSSSVTSAAYGEPDHLSITSPFLFNQLPIMGLHGDLPQQNKFTLSPNAQPVDNSLALVPSVPLLPAIILKVWAYCLDEASAAQNSASLSDLTDSQPEEVLPQTPTQGRTLRLPSVISKTKPCTPMVTSSLRRSARLNRASGEVQHVRLPYAPKKRRQPVEPEVVDGQAKRKLSLNIPPRPDEEISASILVQTMREWGLHCNVPPEELTDSALLTGHLQMVFNDDDETEQ